MLVDLKQFPLHVWCHSFLTYPLISHLGPQRFARSVCLVTCRGIGKGEGVKVVNDSPLHERSGISKNDFQLNPRYMNVVELARMIPVESALHVLV